MLHSLALRSLILVIASHPAQTDGSYLLRRQLTAGTTDVYQMSMSGTNKTTLPQGPPMTMAMSTEMSYALKTLKVAPTSDSADVEATITLSKMDISGPMATAKQPLPKPTTMTGTVSNLGRMNMTLPKSLSAAAAAFMPPGGSITAGLMVELPEKAVKVGDTWDVGLPMLSVLGLDANTKAAQKLTGTEAVGGKTLLVVTCDFQTKISMDAAKWIAAIAGANSNPDQAQALANMHATMKGSIEMSWKGLVDPTTGKTCKMSSTIKMEIVMNIPDQGITIPSTGSYTTVAELK